LKDVVTTLSLPSRRGWRQAAMTESPRVLLLKKNFMKKGIGSVIKVFYSFDGRVRLELRDEENGGTVRRAQ
jgi:hypothetical protein